MPTSTSVPESPKPRARLTMEEKAAFEALLTIIEGDLYSGRLVLQKRLPETTVKALQDLADHPAYYSGLQPALGEARSMTFNKLQDAKPIEREAVVRPFIALLKGVLNEAEITDAPPPAPVLGPLPEVRSDAAAVLDEKTLPFAVEIHEPPFAESAPDERPHSGPHSDTIPGGSFEDGPEEADDHTGLPTAEEDVRPHVARPPEDHAEPAHETPPASPGGWSGLPGWVRKTVYGVTAATGLTVGAMVWPDPKPKNDIPAMPTSPQSGVSNVPQVALDAGINLEVRGKVLTVNIPSNLDPTDVVIFVAEDFEGTGRISVEKDAPNAYASAGRKLTINVALLPENLRSKKKLFVSTGIWTGTEDRMGTAKSVDIP